MQFAGSGPYQASSSAGTLTVNLAATTVTVNAASGRAGHAAALLGTLTQTSGGVGLAVQTVTVFIDGNAVGTSTTVRYGKFGIDYQIPSNMPVGPHTITVTRESG